jgi:hypothetical protein
MDIKLPNSDITESSPSALKARIGNPRKPPRLRPFSAVYPLQYGKGHYKGHPGVKFGQTRAILAPHGVDFGPLHGKLAPPALHVELGPPLGLRQVARLIGCSPWTVRQTLIPRGLPFFQSAASGRLIFYTNQIVAWIEHQQQGGIATK